MDRPETHFDPPEDIPAVSAEDLVDGGVLAHGTAGPDEGGPRRYPSTLGGLFYLVVLGLSLTGLLVAALGPWRTGVQLLGGALLLAAGVRLVLSNRDAGMLAVRHKAVDVSLLVALALLLIVLAQTVPNQPG